MTNDRPVTYAPGHPIAPASGRLRTARLVLYEKLEGEPGSCHWCADPLTWETLCADHLNGVTHDNRPENLVGSCRGCNANRERNGTGRLRPRPCERCGEAFTPPSNRQRFCSRSCAASATVPRGTSTPHGTRARYVYGCRCPACSNVNRVYCRSVDKRRSDELRSADRAEFERLERSARHAVSAVTVTP